ncbi:MAG TPA: GNAT family N-acetyltransferase [Rhizomicrobium sp.]|jgi:RimJ/RimL family protein N-acetyltransferase
MPNPIPNPPDIRLATPDDAVLMAAYMHRLRAEVRDGGLDTVPWRPPPTDEQEHDYLRKTLDNPRACLFIALDGGEVVGRINIAGGELPFDRHAGTLGLSVAPHWRGRGLGRMLMQAAIAEAENWPGFCRIELCCATWNTRGLALYESMGFVTEGIKRKAVNMRGVPEDEVLMALVW